MKKTWLICFLYFISYGSGYAEVVGDFAALQSPQQVVNRQLAEIDMTFGQTAALLHDLQNQATRQKQNLANVQKELQALKNELHKENKELEGQIQAMYAMGKKEKLKLILNQQDSALASRIVAYYEYLNTARTQKLTTVNQTMARLEELTSQQQIESERLEKTLEQKKLEQIKIDQLKKQRHALLKKGAFTFTENEHYLTYLKDNEHSLKNLLSSVQTSTKDLLEEISKSKILRLDRERLAEENKPTQPEESVKTTQADFFQPLGDDFGELKGELAWPIKGDVIHKFGSKRGEGAKWDGVIIRAPEGTEIHSITDGKVVFANWLRGYGILIIVDHGKGYMTLYGFNQSLFKKEGDIVSAGEVIASVGQSGGQEEAGLYFAIRKNAKSLNPLEWCK